MFRTSLLAEAVLVEAENLGLPPVMVEAVVEAVALY
jgi:hypothetical protein